MNANDHDCDLPRPGQRDYSNARLTQHALDRFAERFYQSSQADPQSQQVETALRAALRHCRRLGRNPQNDAIAVLANYQGSILIAIFQKEACVTILTWNQFQPHLHEFGRTRLPKKPRRMLKRLQ